MRSYAVSPDNYDAHADLITVTQAFHETGTFNETRRRSTARSCLGGVSFVTSSQVARGGWWWMSRGGR